MFIIILECYANKITDANIPSTMPGNKEHGFIIMPKEINVCIPFQRVIFSDLHVIRCWPMFKSFPCASQSDRGIRMWFVFQSHANLNKARIQLRSF